MRISCFSQFSLPGARLGPLTQTLTASLWAFWCVQAVRGLLRPGAGSERASDKGGPAGVSRWDEGQLQGPDPGAVQHHARAGRQGKAPRSERELNFLWSVFWALIGLFLCSWPFTNPTSSPLLSLLPWADWMVNLFLLLQFFSFFHAHAFMCVCRLLNRLWLPGFLDKPSRRQSKKPSVWLCGNLPRHQWHSKQRLQHHPLIQMSQICRHSPLIVVWKMRCRLLVDVSYGDSHSHFLNLFLLFILYTDKGSTWSDWASI